MVDRRTALAAVGAALFGGVAGCISDALPGQGTLTPLTEKRSLTYTSTEGDIYFTGSPMTKIEYTVEVTEGPRIDVLVVDESGWEHYANGNFNQFTYYEHLSEIHTRFAEASGEFEEPKSRGLLIDNTNRIGASPSGGAAAVVDIDYAMRGL